MNGRASRDKSLVQRKIHIDLRGGMRAIRMNDHIHRRRSNAFRVNKTLQPAERECQRYVHVYSRPRVVSADGWTVQGWPVHQPDWRREVLRSVLPDGEG